MAAAVKDAENRKILIKLGADPIGGSIEEHDAFIRSEIPKWIRMARDAGIDPQ